MPKNADRGQDWIRFYDERRQDPDNRRMHAIGLPLVALGLLMLIWPLEVMVGSGDLRGPVKVALLVIMVIAVYGMLVSVTLTLGLMILAIPTLLFLDTLSASGLAMMPSGTALLIAGWLLLIRGQRREGKPPYCWGRLQHLPVGLLWLVWRLFSRLGLPR